MVYIWLLVLASVPIGASAPLSGYYKSWEITLEATRERDLLVSEQQVYHNTSAKSVRLSINRLIPVSSIENLSVWDDSGPLEFALNENESGVSVSFETRWISPRSDYRYFISYTAPGAVGGTGFEYRVHGWGNTFATRCENYTLTVIGPENTYPFLSNPEMEVVSYDPPTFRFSSSFDESDVFERVLCKFYETPAYYLVDVSYVVSAYSFTERFVLDVVVLNRENSWQFSSLVLVSPDPSNLYFDEDNNLHLVFDLRDLSPTSVLPIHIQLLYEVSVHDPLLTPAQISELSDLPSSLTEYLNGDNRWWPVDNPYIQEAVNEVVTNKSDVYAAAENLMDFVVDRLDYQSQTERRGALWAYLNRQGDCSEYTDLLITMARAAGIPARAVYGWGYYEEENLRGHAWVELYLPGAGWRPFDPTWAETSGDYFARMDSIHLTRSVMGIQNTESWLSYVSFGPAPECTDSWSITPISKDVAVELYVNAAQTALSFASRLLEESENQELKQMFDEASRAMDEIYTVDNTDLRIDLSKQVIDASYDVIGVLGEKPSYTSRMLNLQVFLIAAVAALIAGACSMLWYAGRKRAW